MARPTSTVAREVNRNGGRAMYRASAAQKASVLRGRRQKVSKLVTNTTLASVVAMAHDLLAWTRLVALDGDLARAEPKRLRYCLLHTAGVIVRSGRRVRLRLAAGWPWSGDLVTAFERVHALRLTA